MQDTPDQDATDDALFKRMLSQQWDRRLSNDEAAKFSDLLAGNPDRQLHYVEESYAREHLRSWSLSYVGSRSESTRSEPIKNFGCNDHDSAAPRDHVTHVDANPRSRGSDRNALRTKPDAWRVSRSIGLFSTAAVVLMAVGLWFSQPADRQQGGAAGGDSFAGDRQSSQASAPQSAPVYVAQISKLSAEASWAEAFGPEDFLLRIANEETLELVAGMAEIQYYSGAKIFLEGPCTFTFTGHDSGRLELGKLTGEVSQGTFLLTTPTAEVLDLGTAFGLAVVEDTSTEVLVYDGEVRVSAASGVDPQAESVSLKKGMGVRVAPSGAIHAMTSRQADSHYPTSHIELLSRLDPEGEVSLVDVFSSFGGPHRRLAGVIDPGTGHWDERPWQYENEAGYVFGSSSYRRTIWHPFLDGVIVPRAEGRRVTINSAGQRVNLPRNSGRTWGAVWSRRRIDGPGMDQLVNDFWARDAAAMRIISDRLAECRDGMIGLHANVCISFDLRAIQAFKESRVSEARTIVANLDNSDIRFAGVKNPPSLYRHSPADLRVYVDGELRERRLGFAREDGEAVLSVPLNEEDRFLSFVSTDHDGNHSFDHVVLIDPILVLEPNPPGQEASP